MLTHIKRILIFILLTSPKAVSIAGVLLFWEFLYRMLVFVGVLDSGMEGFPLSASAVAFTVLFSFDFIVLRIKNSSNKNKSKNE